MTPEKVNEVLDRYEELVEPLNDKEYRHIRTMIPKTRDFLEEGRTEKAMRWLGFIQGALWVKSDFDISSLRSHNRKDPV